MRLIAVSLSLCLSLSGVASARDLKGKCLPEALQYLKRYGINDPASLARGYLSLRKIERFDVEFPNPISSSKNANGRISSVDYIDPRSNIRTVYGARPGGMVPRQFSGEELIIGFPGGSGYAGSKADWFTIEFNEQCKVQRANLRNPNHVFPWVYDIDVALCEHIADLIKDSSFLRDVSDEEMLKYGFIHAREERGASGSVDLTKSLVLEGIPPITRTALLVRQTIGCIHHGLVKVPVTPVSKALCSQFEKVLAGNEPPEGLDDEKISQSVLTQVMSCASEHELDLRWSR